MSENLPSGAGPEHDNTRTIPGGETAPPPPISFFSPKVDAIVRAYTKAFMCDPDIVRWGVIMAACAAVGKKFKVVHRNYYNYPQLYVALVARSGGNKSTPIKKLFAPIYAHDKLTHDEWKEQNIAYKKATPASERVREDMPKWQRKFIQDTTEEALCEALYHNRYGLCQYNDELAGYFNNLFRYNKNDMVQKMLSVWSNTDISIDRKGGDPMYITDPCLSIFGGIQPEVVKKVFRKFDNDDGFAARWLFVIPKNTDLPETTNDNTLSPEAQREWEEYIGMLLGLEEQTVSLDEEAAMQYDTRTNTNNMIANRATDFEHDYRAKANVNVLRVAAAIHLLSGNPRSPISGDDMLKACLLMDRLIEAAVALHKSWAADNKTAPPYSMAEAAIVMTYKYNRDRFKKKEIAEMFNVSSEYVRQTLLKYANLL